MSQENGLSNYFNLKKDEEENQDDLFGDFDIAKLYIVFTKSIVWILFIIIFSLFAVWLYNRYTKPVYQSSSTLKLEVNSKAGILKIGGDIDQDKVSNLAGEIEIIKSKLIYKKVLEHMKLDVSYYAEGKILSEEKYVNKPFNVEYKIKNPAFYNFKFMLKPLSESAFNLSYKLGDGEISRQYKYDELIDNNDFTFLISKTEHSYPLTSTFFFTINSQDFLMNYLTKNVDVEILNLDANTITVSFKDHDMTKAMDIVNAIDTIYLSVTLEAKSKAQEQTLQFLDETLARTEASLVKSEMQLENFVKLHRSTDIPSDFSKNIMKSELFDEEKLKLKVKIASLNDLKESIITNQELKLNISSSSEIEDSQIAKMIGELNTLQLERSRIISSQKENTFVVKSKDAAIKTLKESLVTVIDQSKRILYEKVHELNEKVMELETSFMVLPSKETEYNRIKRAYSINEKYYLLLMEKKAEFGIAKAGNVPNFVILAPASVPSTPIYPNKVFLYFTGILAGLFLSLLLIFVRYFLHNTISTQKELEKGIRAPVLGGIPEYKSYISSRLIVDKSPKSSLSEALRSVRTNLEFICPNKKKKLIAITSTISGEGKTFVTVNLGGIMALSNQKVIILDLDMRKPKVHHAFDGSNTKGMSTLLIGRNTIEECVNTTPIDNLYFISAGPIPPNPSELVLRPEFDETIKKLFEIYDVVMIDTPPVGLVTDGVIILKKVDVAIYIVRANYSKRSVKRSINSLLHTTGFKKLCVVINALKEINTYGAGGYGYGYGHGYYEDDKKPSKSMGKLKKLFTKI